MPVLETHILDIEITERVAKVKVIFVFEDFVYVDYLNLLQIKNQWKIVDKVYIKKSISYNIL